MFEIGWSELMIIAVVALVVIGPKDLPQAIYSIGKWVRKARLVAREFQGHLDDMMREAELDDLRKQALKARDMNIQRMMEEQIDPKGEMKTALDMSKEISATGGHPGSPAEDAPAAPPQTQTLPDPAKPVDPVTAAPPQPVATDKPA